MAGATSAAEPRAGTGQRYGTIVVVGGGCYGSYYVRQLGRAASAGALTWTSLLVVDQDPRCAVARAAERPPRTEVVTAEWHDFFRDYLARSAAREREEREHDAIVPSPLMPHLMSDWLLERARERWPTRRIERRPLHDEPSVPWQRAAPDGTHYLSFAEWMCPINCIEPDLCPEIRGPRTWSMPPAMRAYVDAERRRGHALVGPVLFHCEHRAFGVGMFDTSAVLAGDALVREAGERGAAEVLVGTVSHCHGALALLDIGAPCAAG